MMTVRIAAVFALASCLCAQPRQDARTIAASHYEYTLRMNTPTAAGR